MSGPPLYYNVNFSKLRREAPKTFLRKKSLGFISLLRHKIFSQNRDF